MLESAIATAAKAHEGQTDKAGKPYILHPLRVMLNVKGGIPEQCAAVLHDVIEDTDITSDTLLKLGLFKGSGDAVVLLTRSKDEDYMEYVKRLKANPIARAVKLADLARQHGYVQNTEPDRKGPRPS